MGSAGKYKSLRGMPDILPEESAIMRRVEDKAAGIFRMFGYDEIRIPFLEKTDVFTRSIGEDTDIVEKEMYSFDRGGRSISLRPEGTASVIRAYIEHGWHNSRDMVKLFYTGAMFRGERPQKGRQRQFYQVGAEIIGGSDPYIDAELILSLDIFLKDLGIRGFSILLNSLGCAADRAKYRKALTKYLAGESDGLCDDCRRRSRTNVLRVLDCKRGECRSRLEGAPNILNFLCAACSGNYDLLKNTLTDMKIPFREKKDLVRGLDYYTGTIFEVTHPSLGAQDAIGAGGRYDGLVKQMGGPDVGATGYAVGVERLIMAMGGKAEYLPPPVILVMPVDDESRPEVFRITSRLQRAGVACEMDHSVRSFKGRMRKAGKDRRKFVMLIGEEEIKNGKVLLKNMETGEQNALSYEEILRKFGKEKNNAANT